MKTTKTKIDNKKFKVEKPALKKVATKKAKKVLEPEDKEVLIPEILPTKNEEINNNISVSGDIEEIPTSVVTSTSDEIEYPELDSRTLLKGKEELNREKVKEEEIEEFLKATKEPSLISESEDDKSDNHFYVWTILLILTTLSIFGFYKMFLSQKTYVYTAPTVLNQNQNIVNSTLEKPAPVENISIKDTSSSAINNTETIVTSSDTKNLKDSTVFKSFSYDSTLGKLIALSGTCNDKYYAFLIFDSTIDYRKDPGAAQSNKAFACPSNGKFTVNINLKDLNLQSGKYYIFIADQGSTGSWYNPR
ncbi:MAG: hypothetical protein NTW35_00930 [Candidatus Nomurabacteria bacterium]|nr:hypothetical protein [Candidatus Nomurabacteria bacterium]